MYLVTAEKMKGMVTVASTTRDESHDGHMSSDEDEGR